MAVSRVVTSEYSLHSLAALSRSFTPPTNSADRVVANRAILERISTGITIQNDPSLGPLVRPSDGQEPIQRWFHYREGYTVDLCRRLFDNESFVIDPFCGFGSTLVAARRLGIPSSGLDVSPLATFVSRVKTRIYPPHLIKALRRHVNRLSTLTERNIPSSPPSIRILDKLFHPEILHALLVFRSAIDSVTKAEERDFLLLAWVAILEEVSNVYREGNGIKYRNRQRRGNLYSVTPFDEWQAQQFPPDKFTYVRQKLLSQLNMMVGDVYLLSEGSEPFIIQSDANAAASIISRRKASLIMFSPPYCNCFNYIKAYKLELWMAGFIRAYPDIKSLTAMGVRSRMESLLDPIVEPYPPVIEDLIALMDPDGLWSPQLPDLVRGYFADMQRILATLARALRKGGRCIIVVGNSAYGGVLIPSDLLLAQIARLVGFEIDKIVITRHLTTSSQQKKKLEPIKDFLRESIIHLHKVCESIVES